MVKRSLFFPVDVIFAGFSSFSNYLKMPKDNIFLETQLPAVQESAFDLSHRVKMSFQMGKLVPTLVKECIPGDKWHIKPQNMLRFAPLIAPVMHNIKVITRYFFVPNRILWADWEKYITDQDDIELPYIHVGGSYGDVVSKSLGDYMGLPIEHLPKDIKIQALPFAAYTKIWDDWYRDENLQSEQHVPLVAGDNDDNYSQYVVNPPLAPAWEHDYFTSCLPFSQKGSEVAIPLTFQNNIEVQYHNTNQPWIVRKVDGTIYTSEHYLKSNSGPSPLSGSLHNDNDPATLDPNGTLYVDVQSDAVGINALREAIKIQEWLELNARGGTRYTEQIRAHFGVASSDARLQRAEYIGSSFQHMVISEVLATAQSDNNPASATVPVGQMAGHGISVGGGDDFFYKCEEHGFLIGLIDVIPDTAYQQGIERTWLRRDRTEFAWPTFANLGEQPVYNAELYAASDTPMGTFGYLPAYSDYKYSPNRVAGEFRTNLDQWHLGRIFSTTPALNEDFIKANPSFRIFAVTDEDTDHLYAHIVNQIRVIRKLPRYAVPSIAPANQ